MTSPFEDLILVEIKARLLDLKNIQPLFDHVHEYRNFYAHFNLDQWDADEQTALQKWVVKLTLEGPALDTDNSASDTTFDDLMLIQGKQSEIIEQYDLIFDKLQNCVSPPLSKSQIHTVLEYLYECSFEHQRHLFIWAHKPYWTQWYYFNHIEKDFIAFLSDENIPKQYASKILQNIYTVFNELKMLDQRVVALQTQFSNVCFNYRKNRSRAHFQKEMINDHTYKFNVLEKITTLLQQQTSADFIQAVHGWGQLYIDGQDDQWAGWALVVEHLKTAPLETLPMQLHESAQNLRQLQS